MAIPIIDLHCDLLLYLAMNPERDPFDPISRCSAHQLKQGNVQKQVLAIFAETNPYSLAFGLQELDIFLKLSQKYPEHFSDNIIPAFENASAFCLETEPLTSVFSRLDNILSQITPLYISLTWNGENRFGGGCGSKKGLKPDGEELLSFLSNKNIAIDLSHASDLLAHDILNTIDRKNLSLKILASHSNFRSVHSKERNVPDEIAREIIARSGLIGLVFYSQFLKSPSQLIEHIEYGLKLGGSDALAFGADFFCIADHPDLQSSPGYFDEMSDASKYPQILESLSLPADLLEKIASRNAQRFMQNA
ncbi:MAG: hypothetical protein KR126chlam1_00058 [Chlamydiae bacterium]|nr:hypothetical protein [Chlamydiota bacterium]